MFTSIVWVVEFMHIETGNLDEEQFASEAKAREWAKGPWTPDYRATAIWCEVHTVTAGPREVLR